MRFIIHITDNMEAGCTFDSIGDVVPRAVLSDQCAGEVVVVPGVVGDVPGGDGR